MAFTPITGFGATLTIAGTAHDLLDCTVTAKRDLVEATRTIDLYRTQIASRYSFEVSATIIIDAQATNALMNTMQSQTVAQAAQAFVFNDGGTFPNIYSFSGFIDSAVHNVTNDGLQTLAITIKSSGSVT